jgi:mRNA interferase HicA
VKRSALMRRLREHARGTGLELVVTEGARHTKGQLGDRRATVPRHKELNELTARTILRQLRAGR